MVPEARGRSVRPGPPGAMIAGSTASRNEAMDGAVGTDAWVREAMSLEQNWEMHSKNYNKEVVMKLTGLNEAEADSFMVWFNAQNVLPYTATEYEVRASITYYFDQYKNRKE